MPLFRSEEHLRRWALYDPASAEGTRSAGDVAEVLTTMHGQRLSPDYFLRQEQMAAEVAAAFHRFARGSGFWV